MWLYVTPWANSHLLNFIFCFISAQNIVVQDRALLFCCSSTSFCVPNIAKTKPIDLSALWVFLQFIFLLTFVTTVWWISDPEEVEALKAISLTGHTHSSPTQTEMERLATSHLSRAKALSFCAKSTTRSAPPELALSRLSSTLYVHLGVSD